MAGLNYSQKILLGKALHSKKHGKRSDRLRIYAVLTGFLSMLISLATVIIRVIQMKGG